MICDRKRFMTPSPGQTDSQVDASFQNQNLRTDLRWEAKRIRRLASSRNSHKVVNFTHIQMACDQLNVSTCVGWSNGEKRASTCERRI